MTSQVQQIKERKQTENFNPFEVLKTPIPQELLERQAAVRGDDRIEWFMVADLLDLTFPEWSHEVRDVRAIGACVVVTAAVTINGVTRAGLGTGDATEPGIRKAEQDALKSAGLMFGIGRGFHRLPAEGTGSGSTDEAAPPGDSDVLPVSTSEFPFQTAAAPDSPGERMRAQIAAAFAEIGADPALSLAGYDKMTDDAKRRDSFDGIMKFVIQEKRRQVKMALKGQPWDQEQIARELERFEIREGIDRALPEQIEAVWKDFKKAGMIL